MAAKGFVVCWGTSFYPQIYMNWRRKSVRGLSMDFVGLNISGFLAYTVLPATQGAHAGPQVYIVVLMGSSVVREQYAHRYKDHEPLVRVHDLVFTLHSLFLASITLVQAYIYRVV